MRRLAVIVAALALGAPPAHAVPRARGFDPELAFTFGADHLLAGDSVVAVGRRFVFGWPVTGGAGKRLARVPDLGPGPGGDDLGIDDGGLRIDDAEAGRIAVVRHTIQRGPAEFDLHRGSQLVVGPPEGPMTKVGGCGEVAGTPAALDGGRVAYRARPIHSSCGKPVVTEASIVVRNAAGAVETVVPLPRADRFIGHIELRGDYLAYAEPDWLTDDDGAPVTVVDLRSGAHVTVLPRAQWVWTLGDVGVLYARSVPTRSNSICPAGATRRYAPGDATGVVIPGVHVCRFGMFDETDGALRFNERAADRRFVLRAVDPVTGIGSVLATTAGTIVDGDATHLVADDPDCRSEGARIITLADAPIGPAGPRQCPLRINVQKRARIGETAVVRLRCPIGCRATVSNERRRLRYGPAGKSRTVRLIGHRALRFRVTRDVVRDGRMRIVVRAIDPVGTRRQVFFVSVS